MTRHRVEVITERRGGVIETLRPSGRSAQDAIDGTDARGAKIITEASRDQPVADFPSEYVRVVLLVAKYTVHHHRGCHLATKLNDK